MPRNHTTGTYTAPVNTWNPPVDGTPIDGPDWIAQLADYQDAWTDSLSRSGYGAMLADLQMGAFSSLYSERSAPASPAANILAVYAKDVATVTQLFTKDAAGLETNLNAPGNIANSQLANMAQTTFKMRAAGAGTGAPIDGTAAQAITALALSLGIEFVIDGGGSVLTTGIKGYIEVPFDCTITRATLLADQSGSVVVDIFKSTYSAFDPPTHPASADKITASAPPTITTAKKSQDSTLTGWTTSVTAGDILAFNINSVTTITRVTCSLKVTRTSA